ncbi:hypothetical protein A2635_01190 [Candidatus Peribacteria bacterium RIFCSPHIGHO2_01_FULL_51_9]|nr:MAG: hypothetical protein A2635_01190 [Candidatus Peribacteria bacterium RIFCSPHIGHO2_01_FULL_51_9]
MRVLLLANNWVGWKVAEFLAGHRDTEVVGVIVHPDLKRKYGDEILKALSLPASRVFDGSKLQEQKVLSEIQELKPEIGISVFFDYILKKEFLDIFPKGCINIHPAYLPYNRGSYPNIFSIIDGTPAGATVHFMTDGIDMGDIIARKEVPVELTDTGESLYRKLEGVSIEVFQNVWSKLIDGTAQRIPQNPAEGTVHRYKDTEAIDTIDLQKSYNAQHLINILRARTFPPYKGAYFLDENGEKVYIRVQLLRENEL